MFINQSAIANGQPENDRLITRTDNIVENNLPKTKSILKFHVKRFYCYLIQ
jgi:hypothetical protein